MIIDMNIIKTIGLLPKGSWARIYAEMALAAGAKPVAMRDIPESYYRIYALNQQRTIIENGHVCITLDEFIRISAMWMKPLIPNQVTASQAQVATA